MQLLHLCISQLHFAEMFPNISFIERNSVVEAPLASVCYPASHHVPEDGGRSVRLDGVLTSVRQGDSVAGVQQGRPSKTHCTETGSTAAESTMLWIQFSLVSVSVYLSLSSGGVLQWIVLLRLSTV